MSVSNFKLFWFEFKLKFDNSALQSFPQISRAVKLCKQPKMEV